jgi:hypothetical protein
MKMEQLIVQYLYSNKKVTLQDIGTFTMNSDVVIPQEADKDTVLPENAIEFVYDPRAGVDEGLIQYIVENSRKIRPLATSDLESFVILNKQFLNIGKPLIVEGLGTLQKTQEGIYSFTQSGVSHVTAKDAPKVITEKINEKVNFTTPKKEISTGINKKLVATIAAVVLLAGLSYAAYYFITKNKDAGEVVEKETGVASTDTSLVKNNSDTSTTLKIKDSTTKIISANNINDSNSFYVVIKEYQDLLMAQKRLQKLNSYGNKLILTTKDSITYKMKMPFKLPLTDTLRTKDSLAKFFQAKTYIELP